MKLPPEKLFSEDYIAGLVYTSAYDARVSLEYLLDTQPPADVISVCLRLIAYMDKHKIEHPKRRAQVAVILDAARKLDSVPEPADRRICDLCGHPNPAAARTCSRCYAPLD